MAFTIETCPECTAQGWDVYDIRSSAIRKWRNHANTWGKKYGVNPGLLLSIVSIESNGSVNATPYYGLTQIGKDMLNSYNTAKNTSYKLTDLRAEGPNITTEDEAASLSIKIFAEFISRAMAILDSATDMYLINPDKLIKDATTNWNGDICGAGINYFTPFSSENGGSNPGSRAIRESHSCYGINIYNLMEFAKDWCGTSPYYENDLPDISFSTKYHKVVGNYK